MHIITEFHLVAETSFQGHCSLGVGNVAYLNCYVAHLIFVKSPVCYFTFIVTYIQLILFCVHMENNS